MGMSDSPRACQKPMETEDAQYRKTCGYQSTKPAMPAENRIKQRGNVGHALNFATLITRAGSRPAHFRIKDVPATAVEIVRHHSCGSFTPAERINKWLFQILEPE